MREKKERKRTGAKNNAHMRDRTHASGFQRLRFLPECLIFEHVSSAPYGLGRTVVHQLGLPHTPQLLCFKICRLCEVASVALFWVPQAVIRIGSADQSYSKTKTFGVVRFAPLVKNASPQ